MDRTGAASWVLAAADTQHPHGAYAARLAAHMPCAYQVLSGERRYLAHHQADNQAACAPRSAAEENIVK